MNPTHANSRERLQRAIDAEIKSLEESIRALKLHRNALSAVSSLAPEVLAVIFSFLCSPGIPSLGGKPDQTLAQLCVSHVCHQWREIILNQPLLWGHVNFTTLSSAGITEVLLRSKSLPLYMEGRISSRRWGEFRFYTFQVELQAHFPRICHLRISAEHHHLLQTLEGLILPAPTLKYLSLTSHGGDENRVDLLIPETLFDGSAPGLSHLELRNCDISWNSPLLKGLEHLEILRPSANARPELSLWLGTLVQMIQLKTLVLHAASPVSPPFPFDVERTTTLPSLTHLDISGSSADCALALAHLNVPTVTSVCLTVIYDLPTCEDIQKLLPYVVQHISGPQDTRPLQSVLIRCDRNHLEILAWPVPDIDVELPDTPVLLGVTLPPRVALAFRTGPDDWSGLGSDAHRDILDWVMAGLPLNDLVTLAAQDIDDISPLARDLAMKQFGLLHAPRWSLLRRVRLAIPVEYGLIRMVLADDGGRENLLLPSLTELVLVSEVLDADLTTTLCDALMKRVEQGVPLEMLDLRMCRCYRELDDLAAVQSFREIVVDVLGPEEKPEARERMKSMWDPLTPFIGDEKYGEETHSDRGINDDQDDHELSVAF
jgi:hypothetical protein